LFVPGSQQETERRTRRSASFVPLIVAPSPFHLASDFDPLDQNCPKPI
jgi:hypothetical protein